jgi:hypothetical protein
MFSKYNKNYQIKEDEMGRICGTHEGEEKCIQVLGGNATR